MSDRTFHLSLTTSVLDLKAREVQLHFSPSTSSARGLDYYGTSLAANGSSADFFDFLPLDGGQLLAAIGNVSGQETASTIIVSGLRAYLRTIAAEYQDDLRAVVRQLNRNLWRISPDDIYSTLFLARIDPGEHRLEYVSAAHETALLMRENGRRILRLESTGAVLGLSERSAYQKRTVAIEHGDVLLVFTDGVAEATDQDGHQFGAERLTEVVREHRHSPAAELARSVLDSLDSFAGHVRQDDDRTLIAARLRGSQHAEVVKEECAALAFAAA